MIRIISIDVRVDERKGMLCYVYVGRALYGGGKSPIRNIIPMLVSVLLGLGNLDFEVESSGGVVILKSRFMNGNTPL